MAGGIAPRMNTSSGPEMEIRAPMSELRSKMLIERRFPVRLGQKVETLHRAYDVEKAAHWNPVGDIPWARLDADSLDGQARDAARRMWSRRLWAAWGFLSETPATLIRLCLELDRPISPKFFLTVRNTQEACHIDVMQRLAEAHGGYLAEPAAPAYASILHRDLSQRVLHADTFIDGFILAHGAVKIGAEAALYARHGEGVENDAVAAVLRHIAEDKRRHAAFGWDFIAERVAAWSEADRAAAQDEVTRLMDEIVLSGFLSPFMAAEGLAAAECGAEELCAARGLGSAPRAAQLQIMADYLDSVRMRLDAWGIALPDARIC